MTYIPQFLTTLSHTGSNALQMQAKSVFSEFASGQAGAIARRSFESMMCETFPVRVGNNVSADAGGGGGQQQQDDAMEAFRAFNLAFDETIGLSAHGYTQQAGGYRCDDLGIAATAAAVEFRGLFEATMTKEGFKLSAQYSLSVTVMGTLTIKDSGNDAAINTYLQDKLDIQQSFMRITSAFSMHQMGLEYEVTNAAYMRVSMSGNYTSIKHVVDMITTSHFQSVSLAFSSTGILPLFDGKGSQERLDFLNDLFREFM